uniref:Uncharacterized protein n=1 Tax=Glossina palpalis gambiensis TaxID=67801 RepID=A0A1B0BJL9_9MUSC
MKWRLKTVDAMRVLFQKQIRNQLYLDFRRCQMKAARETNFFKSKFIAIRLTRCIVYPDDPYARNLRESIRPQLSRMVSTHKRREQLLCDTCFKVYYSSAYTFAKAHDDEISRCPL